MMENNGLERFCDMLLCMLGLLVIAGVVVSLDQIFGIHLLEAILS